MESTTSWTGSEPKSSYDVVVNVNLLFHVVDLHLRPSLSCPPSPSLTHITPNVRVREVTLLLETQRGQARAVWTPHYLDKKMEPAGLCCFRRHFGQKCDVDIGQKNWSLWVLPAGRGSTDSSTCDFSRLGRPIRHTYSKAEVANLWRQSWRGYICAPVAGLNRLIEHTAGRLFFIIHDIQNAARNFNSQPQQAFAPRH